MIPEIEQIASIENLVDKKLYFMGLLTREAENRRSRPIVVGGSAVDIYTEGLFPSDDIDLIGERKKIGEILEQDFGFKPSDRGWISEEIELFVEIPSPTLDGDRDKITTARMEGLNVYIIGLEDLIVDRLASCIFWKFQPDCTKARFLLKKYWDKLDTEYLGKKAEKEALLDTLKSFIAEEIDEGPQKTKHPAKKGWFEEQEPVVTEKGLENKAPRHRKASAEKKLKDALRKPILRE